MQQGKNLYVFRVTWLQWCMGSQCFGSNNESEKCKKRSSTWLKKRKKKKRRGAQEFFFGVLDGKCKEGLTLMVQIEVSPWRGEE